MIGKILRPAYISLSKDLFSRLLIILALIALPCRGARTAESDSKNPNKNQHNNIEKVQIETFQKEYLEKKKSDSIEVVTQRAFKKAGKINASLFFNLLQENPFLNTIGGSLVLGWNISEIITIEGLGSKLYASPAYAQDYLIEQTQNIPGYKPVKVNTNNYEYIFGSQALLNILYGKISFFNLAIFYFDFYILAGGGALMSKQTNALSQEIKKFTQPTGWIGFGVQLFLLKRVALRIDWRLFGFSEQIFEQNKSAIMTPLTSTAQMVYGNNTSIGINFLLF